MRKERELISKRTKEALAARKAVADLSDANRHAYAAIKFMQGSLKQKADYLNENGFKTSKGSSFNPIQVSRLIQRYEPTVK